MPIKYVKGDLFAAEDLPALAHGCNCKGVMGKGIAREFRKRYPDMYQAYRQRCLAGDFQPGDVFVWETDPVVFNLATQSRPGPYAELTAIETAVKRMIGLCDQLNIKTVGLPRIGAGLGKLAWSSVKATLEEIAQTTEIELIIFEFDPDESPQT